MARRQAPLRIRFDGGRRLQLRHALASRSSAGRICGEDTDRRNAFFQHGRSRPLRPPVSARHACERGRAFLRRSALRLRTFFDLHDGGNRRHLQLHLAPQPRRLRLSAAVLPRLRRLDGQRDERAVFPFRFAAFLVVRAAYDSVWHSDPGFSVSRGLPARRAAPHDAPFVRTLCAPLGCVRSRRNLRRTRQFLHLHELLLSAGGHLCAVGEHPALARGEARQRILPHGARAAPRDCAARAFRRTLVSVPSVCVGHVHHAFRAAVLRRLRPEHDPHAHSRRGAQRSGAEVSGE